MLFNHLFGNMWTDALHFSQARVCMLHALVLELLQLLNASHIKHVVARVALHGVPRQGALALCAAMGALSASTRACFPCEAGY